MADSHIPLSSLVVLPKASDPSAEDIFAASLDLISPDGSRNSYGDPGTLLTYKSRKFGDIRLSLADPKAQQDRLLMAHYLWNASIQISEFISGLGITETRAAEASWDVAGKRVLELGAGTGLAGIVSALAGASEAVITDHPTKELLSAIQSNVENNVGDHHLHNIYVKGHEWGQLDDSFAKVNAGKFNIVLAADCLWMPGEHESLTQSMLNFLSLSENARVWVVAGFHTGRAVLATFLEVAKEGGLSTEKVWERDAFGNERDFAPNDGERREDATIRSRWLMVAILKWEKWTSGSARSQSGKGV